MDLRCYDDGRPLSAEENAVLAVRKQHARSGDGGTGAAAGEPVLFHIDCYPTGSEDWIEVRRGPAGLLHDAPP
jgi:hypothetical protein